MKYNIIFTSKNDVHADRLIVEMEKRASVLRLDLDAVSDWKFSFSRNEIVLHAYDQDFCLNECHSCFVRRLPSLEPYLDTIPNHLKENSDYIAQQKFVLFSDALSILNITTRFVNPLSSSSGHGKAVQALIAQQVGLLTPKTYIGSSAILASRFLNEIFENKKEAAVKPIANVATTIGGKKVTSFTNIIRKEQSYDLSSIELCPTILQEYIDKKYEIRGTIIGKKIFSAQIMSQEAGGQTAIDWRRYNIPRTPHYPYELPTYVAEKIIALHQKLGFKYASFDLIRTSDDDYVFLETNPYGQWLWIEDLTGLPITRSIADYLLSAS